MYDREYQKQYWNKNKSEDQWGERGENDYGDLSP